jgi:hypothetical protein
MNVFEFMVARSPHNNDFKGLKAIRNIEITLSDLNMAINFNKVTTPQQKYSFMQSYNLGKESVSEREMIFSTDVASS